METLTTRGITFLLDVPRAVGGVVHPDVQPVLGSVIAQVVDLVALPHGRGVGADRHRDGAAHPGNDFITDACFGQRLAFLSAAPKDKGVAAFEPHDDLPRARLLDHQLIDLLLRAALTFRFLTYIDQFRRRGYFLQQFRGDQAVIEHHIGAAQAG